MRGLIQTISPNEWQDSNLQSEYIESSVLPLRYPPLARGLGKLLASGGNTVVEPLARWGSAVVKHLSHYPYIDGSNLATRAGH